MQQFPFIDLFKPALHVSTDKLSLPQEHFLVEYTALVECTDNAADRWQGCHRSAAISVHSTKSCTYSQKVLLRMGEFVAREM